MARPLRRTHPAPPLYQENPEFYEQFYSFDLHTIDDVPDGPLYARPASPYVNPLPGPHGYGGGINNVERGGTIEASDNLFKRGVNNLDDVQNSNLWNRASTAFVDTVGRVTTLLRGGVAESPANLFKRGENTLSDVLDDSTFARVSSAHLISNKPVSLYRPTGGDVVSAETLSGAFGASPTDIITDNFEVGSTSGTVQGWTYGAGVNLQATNLYAASGTRSATHNHGGAATASQANRPLGTLIAGRVYTASVRVRHNMGNTGAAAVLRIVPASGNSSPSDVTVLDRRGNDYSGAFGYPCDTGSGAINADTGSFVELSVTFRVNVTQTFTVYLATGYFTTTNGFAAYDLFSLRGESSGPLNGGIRGLNALDANNRLINSKTQRMVGLASPRSFIVQPGTATNGGALYVPLSSNGALITIAPFDLLVGNYRVSYSGGVTSAPTTGVPIYVWLNDPTYAGGSVQYGCERYQEYTAQSDDRLYIGQITPSSSGGGGSPAPGGGAGQPKV